MLNAQQKQWIKEFAGYDVDAVIGQLKAREAGDNKKADHDMAEMKKLLPSAEDLLVKYPTNPIGLINAAAKHGVKDLKRFSELAADYFGKGFDATLAHARIEELTRFEKEVEAGLAKGAVEVNTAKFSFSVQGGAELSTGVAHFIFQSRGHIPDVQRSATVRNGMCTLDVLPIGQNGLVHIRLELKELRGQGWEPQGSAQWDTSKFKAGKIDLMFQAQVDVTADQIANALGHSQGATSNRHAGNSRQTERETSDTVGASGTVSDSVTIAGKVEENLGVEKSELSASNQATVSATANAQHTSGSKSTEGDDRSRDDGRNSQDTSQQTRTGNLRNWSEHLTVKMI